jgi:hypothetical protein
MRRLPTPRWSSALLAASISTALACGSTDGAPWGGAGNGMGGSGDASGGTLTSGGAPAAGTGGTVVSGGAGSSADGGVGASGGDSAGGTAGGATGASGAGGSSGSVSEGAGGAPVGDTPAPRPLQVTAAAARHSHTFRSKDADAGVTFNDNTEIAILDNRAPKLVGKLVLPFQGQGVKAGVVGPNGEFCARRGFHVLAIAAFQDYTITIDDSAFYGDARKQVWDGIEHTRAGDFASIHMTPADGVAQRTQKALQYLDEAYPDEDWGYYLNADGSVRWSDVILTGMSHGASNAARWAMLVRVSRVVSLSGPRDNMCTSLNASNCGGVVATWLSETPSTPIDRFYALTGVNDSQHLQHLFAMQTMKYVGAATNVAGMQPPYANSHRLIAAGGHADYCDLASYQGVCNYLFGVPTENHQGLPP